MKKIFIPASLLMALFLILLGCETSSSVIRLGDSPGGYTTLSYEGTELRLGYLNVNTLQRLYGNRNNPFVAYKTGALIVIEAAIQSDTPLQLQLQNAQLSTPGGNKSPTSNQEVYEYWFSRLKHNYGTKSRFNTPHKSDTLDPHGTSGSTSTMGVSLGGAGKNQYHNWSLKVVTEIIDESILPPEFDIEGGAETEGYILFNPVRGERNVDATFALPVYDDKGELLHEFELTFPI